MANLAKDPTGWQLEDLVAAHFVSRGCYVETGIKERNPDELLELDIVWTDYRKEPAMQGPVETKSGEWGLGDVFKCGRDTLASALGGSSSLNLTVD